MKGLLTTISRMVEADLLTDSDIPIGAGSSGLGPN
jgi:hypothetical protein